MKPMEAEGVHAHKVMEMLVASGRSWDRGSLEQAIEGTFGEGTRFYTCSAEGLSAGELIEFLEAKGKFSGPAESFVFDPGRMCRCH